MQPTAVSGKFSLEKLVQRARADQSFGVATYIDQSDEIFRILKLNR